MAPAPEAQVMPRDVLEPVEALFRDLRSRPEGLRSREAERRLVAYGPNELAAAAAPLAARSSPGSSRTRWRCCSALAAGLAFAAGTAALGLAVLAVIVLNALFAFVAGAAGRAGGRGAAALPARSRRRCAATAGAQRVPAAELVPGDVLLVEEGERVSADARLLEGDGRGRPLDADRRVAAGAARRRGSTDADAAPLLEARDVALQRHRLCRRRGERRSSSRRGCRPSSGGSPRSPSGSKPEPSPLELQVRRVAWLIARGRRSRPGSPSCRSGWLAAGLPLKDAFSFAIGLIVANVPEGLLPTITLALAVGVADLARRGALVKRLSRGGDARLDDGHLHRQDRHADREPDARGARLDAARRGRPRSRSDDAGSRRRREPGARLARPRGRGLLARPSSTPSATGKSRGEATEVGMLEAARAARDRRRRRPPRARRGAGCSASTRRCG